MRRLSPSDAMEVAGMAGVLSSCGSYLLVSLRVRLDRPFPRVVRILEGLGARLDYVDEEQRRITALVPITRIASLAEVEGEYTDYMSVTVKASCRGEPGAVGERLRGMGFTRVSRGSTSLYLGSYRGRAVEVEVSGRRVKVKVGARTTGRPRLPVPPSLFTLDLREAREAVGVLNEFIAELKGS